MSCVPVGVSTNLKIKVIDAYSTHFILQFDKKLERFLRINEQKLITGIEIKDVPQGGYEYSIWRHDIAYEEMYMLKFYFLSETDVTR
jgi:hypothetical protein